MQCPNEKGQKDKQTMIYKALHRKLKRNTNTTKTVDMNSCAPEW